MHMRILVCSTDVPHPERGASMVILHCYLEALRKAGFDVFHLIVHTPKANAEHLKAYKEMFPGSVLSVEVRDSYERRHAWQPYVPVSLPADVIGRLRAFDADILFGFDIAAAGILKKAGLSGKRIAWLGDLNFQTAWYHGLYAVKENIANIPLLPIAWLKKFFWKRLYHSVLRDADCILVALKSSERELGVPCSFLPYPWPAEKTPIAVTPRPSVPTFVFLGNLSGLGSRSALHFLLDDIYPEMLKKWGGGKFSIVICGINKLPEWVEKRIAPMPEMTFIGFADDLAALLLSSHGAIVPIDVPVGNRTRIVTCMSLRVPVVAHPNTALGNPSLVDGQTCYLAADAVSFVEKMDRLFMRVPGTEEMIARAKESYDAEYEPVKAGEALVQELGKHASR